jgi:hypothetical protein
MNVELNEPVAIKMDGAVMKLVNPQLATIKRMKTGSYLLVGCLGPVVLVLLTMLLISLFGNKNGFQLDTFLAILFGMAIFGGLIYTQARSMGLPNYTFDGATQTLEISGRNGRTLPFDGIQSISILPKTNAGAMAMVDVCLDLKEGGQIRLGNMSGARGQVEQRAEKMKEILQALTDAGSGR